jgi:hypothetical protein
VLGFFSGSGERPAEVGQQRKQAGTNGKMLPGFSQEIVRRHRFSPKRRARTWVTQAKVVAGTPGKDEFRRKRNAQPGKNERTMIRALI